MPNSPTSLPPLKYPPPPPPRTAGESCDHPDTHPIIADLRISPPFPVASHSDFESVPFSILPTGRISDEALASAVQQQSTFHAKREIRTHGVHELLLSDLDSSDNWTTPSPSKRSNSPVERPQPLKPNDRPRMSLKVLADAFIIFVWLLGIVILGVFLFPWTSM